MLLVLALACRQPPEAPTDVADLSLFLFETHGVEDSRDYVHGLGTLRGIILDADLDASPSDRALTMPTLDGEALGGLSIPEGASAEDQVGVAVPGRFPHPLEDQRALFLDPNQVCISSESTTWASRSFATDPECFESGTCDTLSTVTETYKDSVFIKVWLDLETDYRAFTLEDDTRAFVSRTALPLQSFSENGNKSWDQHFALDVYLEDPADPNSTLRWTAVWSSVDIPGVPNSLLSGSLVGGIDERSTFADEYLRGDIQTCRNDRDLDKPERW